MTTASAPGKIILVGEHAVVYGRPALAVPVHDVQATATVRNGAPGSGLTLHARDLGRTFALTNSQKTEEPLIVAARLALARLGFAPKKGDLPSWQVELHSEIPMASGLGSGAAISAALVRAMFAHANQPVDAATVSEIVFESERLHHGTPSGIDNTVIAYGQPVWFIKGQPPQTFIPRLPLTLAIADSGLASPTRETVGDMRAAWQREPERYERLFDEMGAIAVEARGIIEINGEMGRLGDLFNRNHALLQTIGVSSPTLDRLVDAARDAGAFGAKLSGGGRGGNVIALVSASTREAVVEALVAAGARRVIVTSVESQNQQTTGEA